MATNPEAILQYAPVAEASSLPNDFVDFYPPLLQRSDTAGVWVRLFQPDENLTQRMIIGIMPPALENPTIMQVEYSRVAGGNFEPETITIHTPAEHDEEHLVSGYRSWGYKWSRIETEGSKASNVPRRPQDWELLRSMRNSGFLYHSELPERFNIKNAAAVFWAKIEGWLADPESFNSADLKPDFITPVPENIG